MTQGNQLDEAAYEKKLQEIREEGKKFAIEMGESFKPYLAVLAHHGVKNVEESMNLFGLYLRSRKKDAKGYRTISKFGFSQFLLELLMFQKD